jgi:hypothetical protein
LGPAERRPLPAAFVSSCKHPLHRHRPTEPGQNEQKKKKKRRPSSRRKPRAPKPDSDKALVA